MKRRRNRSRIEIYRDILGYLDEHPLSRKTHILYASNMNTRAFEKAFNRLIQVGAVASSRSSNGDCYYRLTRLGATLLDEIRELSSILGGEREERDLGLIIERNCSQRICEDIGEGDVSRRTITGSSGQKYTVLVARGSKIAIINIPEEFLDKKLGEKIAETLILLLDTDLYILIIAPESSRERIRQYIEALCRDTRELQNLFRERTAIVYIN